MALPATTLGRRRLPRGASSPTPSMLLAAFALARDGVVSFPEAIDLVSRNPGRLMGDPDARGRVAVGERADIARVRDEAAVRLEALMVSGTPILHVAGLITAASGQRIAC